MASTHELESLPNSEIADQQQPLLDLAEASSLMIYAALSPQLTFTSARLILRYTSTKPIGLKGRNMSFFPV